MSENIDRVVKQLESLDLTAEESIVYLEILQGRGDTALALARSLKLARTKVYRILDSLIAKKMVVTRLGDRGSRFLATPPQELSFLLDDRQHRLDQLKESLPALQSSLVELATTSKDSSRVLYYHNLDGIKQVTYNSLKAKGELLTYEIGNMDSFMSHKEAEKLRESFIKNKIHIRTLTNLKEIKDWTNVTDMVENYWKIRYLEPKSRSFQFDILIYNSVYCLYRYSGGKAFAVEIHSQELADMQRQLFEYLWTNARRFKVTSRHGAAHLA